MLLKNQLSIVKEECSKHNAMLIAVTKTRGLEELQDLFDAGQISFGENRVQELLEKKEALPASIQWHLIGHLQTNKVKYIADFIAMIHSVDSIKLLKEINKQGKKNEKVLDCLLQFHVAEEDSKFGIAPNKLQDFMQQMETLDLSHVQIRGIMGMASFTDNKDQVVTEFRELKNIFNTLKNKYFKEHTEFNTLSMGMSGDYSLALQEGSTMVRVGSKLFQK